MSIAGRALIVARVAATTPSTSAPTFVHIGGGPVMSLEEHAGRTRLFELATDDLGSSGIVPMTLCTSTLWREDLVLRVRYEAAGPIATGLDATMRADARAIVASLRAGTWAPTLDLLQAGHAATRVEEYSGPDGEPLAKVIVIPVRIQFYE